MKNLILTGILGAALCGARAYAADIVVHVKPPALRVERRPHRPAANYVWVSGYHRWEGNQYVWTPGQWEVPPREHAVWVAPRWEHRNGGYVFVEGRWR
jgi:hypothetical protein